MFGMTKVVVMVLTMWLSNGSVSVQSLVASSEARDVQSCEQDAGKLSEMLVGKEVEAGVRIVYVAPKCFEEVQGQHV